MEQYPRTATLADRLIHSFDELKLHLVEQRNGVAPTVRVFLG
jgi:hypothetical protein